MPTNAASTPTRRATSHSAPPTCPAAPDRPTSQDVADHPLHPVVTRPDLSRVPVGTAVPGGGGECPDRRVDGGEHARGAVGFEEVGPLEPVQHPFVGAGDGDDASGALVLVEQF